MKDATCWYYLSVLLYRYFNPRIREGCDSNIVSLRYSRFVLIHAPVRDATRIWNCCPLFCANFNPRTHKRVRPKEEIIFSEMSSTILIHTPERGATYFYVIHDILTSYFNPRTHEGCDKKVFCNDWFWHFNPRIRKGCDDYTAKTMTGRNRF